MPAPLKSYPPPWKGNLVLVCRKCQKKLKGDDEHKALANVKKTLKRDKQKLIHILNVPCMKVCPKDAVTVYDPNRPKGLSILRSSADLDAFVALASSHRAAG